MISQKFGFICWIIGKIYLFFLGVEGRIGQVALPRTWHPALREQLIRLRLNATAPKNEIMPSSKKRITTYLTDKEYQQVADSAAKAGLSFSTFVKRVCLGHKVPSTVDHQAILALTKANADLGRLGGLFKMFLSEGKAGQHADELRVTLRKIEESKDAVAKQFDNLIKGFAHK